MTGIPLKRYLAHAKITQADLSREIGQSRQTINYWLQHGATVEYTEIGIRIKTERIVFESQVAK